MFTYKYLRPMLTVDVLLFSLETDPASVLLIKRKNEPFKDMWAIPGGFVDMDEEIEAAARREMQEETGLEIGELIQTSWHTKPGRDPRGRTITAVFVSLNEKNLHANAGDDAADSGWFKLSQLPQLAFDHHDIIRINREKIPELIIKDGLFYNYFEQDLNNKNFEKIFRKFNWYSSYESKNIVVPIPSSCKLYLEWLEKKQVT